MHLALQERLARLCKVFSSRIFSFRYLLQPNRRRRRSPSRCVEGPKVLIARDNPLFKPLDPRPVGGQKTPLFSSGTRLKEMLRKEDRFQKPRQKGLRALRVLRALGSSAILPLGNSLRSGGGDAGRTIGYWLVHIVLNLAERDDKRRPKTPKVI